MDGSGDQLRDERWALLRTLDGALSRPLLVLSFVWLGLLIVDVTSGLPRALEIVSYGIWAVFIVDFLLELTIAPDRLRFIRHNWITALSLVLPAFRVLRVVPALRALRLVRFARSVTLVRLLTSVNRGMGALSRALGQRGLGYLFALTVLVTFAGAAGMAHFESPASLGAIGRPDAGGLASYGDAVWWTAMIMTTMGSDYWPHTPEGRILGWLLAVYAFAVFGYLTASIASLLVARDRDAARHRA